MDNNKQLVLWKLLALFLFFALLSVSLIAKSYISVGTPVTPIKTPIRTPNQFPIPSAVTSGRIGLFLTSVPKPIEKLTVEDLPSYRTIRGVVKYNDKYLFTGEGSIFEADPKTSQITKYTDPNTFYCGNNLAIIGDFLYVPCINGIVNFESTDFFSNYEVYKISLINYSLVQKYGRSDGLKSGANVEVFADGDVLWVPTFEGLGKIDTKNNKVSFYDKELGILGTKFEVNDVLIDKDYDWFYVPANAYSKGGIVMLNKATGVFKPFSVNELKNNKDRFDLDFGSNGYGWKLIPGGIKIAFRDNNSSNNEETFIKNYNYESGKWVFETSVPIATSGDYISANFLEGNHFRPYESKDGLSQLVISSDSGVKTTINIEGRSALFISPLINGKRYIVTSGSVDVIDERLAFPKLILKLNESLSSGEPSFYDRANVNLLVDNETLQAVALARPFCGQGCSGPIIFFLDLNKGVIIKRYDVPYEQVSKRKFGDEKMTKTQDQYIVNDSSGSPLFSIGANSFELKVY